MDDLAKFESDLWEAADNLRANPAFCSRSTPQAFRPRR
jgi:hypothetical protein